MLEIPHNYIKGALFQYNFTFLTTHLCDAQVFGTSKMKHNPNFCAKTLELLANFKYQRAFSSIAKSM